MSDFSQVTPFLGLAVSSEARTPNSVHIVWNAFFRRVWDWLLPYDLGLVEVEEDI